MKTEAHENATGFSGGGGGGREDDFALEHIEDAAERVSATEGGVAFMLNCGGEASPYSLALTPFDGLFFEPHQARELAAALIAAAARAEREVS